MCPQKPLSQCRWRKGGREGGRGGDASDLFKRTKAKQQIASPQCKMNTHSNSRQRENGAPSDREAGGSPVRCKACWVYRTGIHPLRLRSLFGRRTATRWRCSSHSDKRSGPPRTSARGRLGDKQRDHESVPAASPTSEAVNSP